MARHVAHIQIHKYIHNCSSKIWSDDTTWYTRCIYKHNTKINIKLTKWQCELDSVRLRLMERGRIIQTLWVYKRQGTRDTWLLLISQAELYSSSCRSVYTFKAMEGRALYYSKLFYVDGSGWRYTFASFIWKSRMYAEGSHV